MALRHKGAGIGQYGGQTHEKLDSVELRGFAPDENLTGPQILSGLVGGQKHGFFAKMHSNDAIHRRFLESLSDGRIKSAVLDLAREPDRLVDELKKSMGGRPMGSVSQTLRPARLGSTIASSEGRNLYSQMVSDDNGAKAASRLFSDPAGARIMATAGKLGGQELVSDMQEQILKGLHHGEKQSNKMLWPVAKPVSTTHLQGDKTDAQIRDLIRSPDRVKAMETVAEFFSSDAKFERFRSFIGDDQNRAALSASLKDDAARTQYAFLCVLKTGGGKQRLARAIADANGSKVIRELAKNPEGQEAIFGTLHAREQDKDGRTINHGMDVASMALKEPGGKDSFGRLNTTIYLNRLMRMSGAPGDVPLEKVNDIAV